MPIDPAPVRPTTLLVADTPKAGAGAFRPTMHDVRFVSHDDLGAAPDPVDLSLISEIFVSLGRGQRASLEVLLSGLRADGQAHPDIYVEIPRDVASADADALLDLLQEARRLRNERATMGAEAPRLLLHAADEADSDRTFELAKAHAHEVRLALEHSDPPVAVTAETNGLSASAAQTNTRQPGLDKMRQRLQRQNKKLARQDRELEELRGTALVAGWYDQLDRLARRSPLRRVHLARTAAFMGAIVVMGGIVVLVAVGSLAVGVAVVGALAASSVILTAVMLLELARVRAEQRQVRVAVMKLVRTQREGQRRQKQGEAGLQRIRRDLATLSGQGTNASEIQARTKHDLERLHAKLADIGREVRLLSLDLGRDSVAGKVDSSPADQLVGSSERAVGSSSSTADHF